MQRIQKNETIVISLIRKVKWAREHLFKDDLLK